MALRGATSRSASCSSCARSPRLVFGTAAGALAAKGHTALAIAFAAVAVISGTLNFVWRSPEAVLGWRG